MVAKSFFLSFLSFSLAFVYVPLLVLILIPLLVIVLVPLLVIVLVPLLFLLLVSSLLMMRSPVLFLVALVLVLAADQKFCPKERHGESPLSPLGTSAKPSS